MTPPRVHVLAVLLLSLGCAAPPRPAAHQLPAGVRLVDPDHTPFVAAERYRGRVVVLDFWAGWCAQCRDTVPQLQRLADAFAPRGLVVVGVNAGDTAAAARAHARDLGITYPIALDPELELSDRLGATNLPSLLVIDRDGTVVHRARRVDPETLAVIRSLLAGAL